jgi:hypothetical protein
MFMYRITINIICNTIINLPVTISFITAEPNRSKVRGWFEWLKATNSPFEGGKGDVIYFLSFKKKCIFAAVIWFRSSVGPVPPCGTRILENLIPPMAEKIFGNRAILSNRDVSRVLE